MSDVYPGTNAAAAHVEVGDEVVSVDGESYSDLRSFDGKFSVSLRLRRHAGEEPFSVQVLVSTMQPGKVFEAATDGSRRLHDMGGIKIGYVRVWALDSYVFGYNLQQALKAGLLADADGLIVDLRGRWGGRSTEIPDLLRSNGPELSHRRRDGQTQYQMANYHRPIVAIVDEGTRSALEIFARILQNRGAKVVGKRTAGAVLGAGGFLLPDNSLLILPIAEVRLDGEVLEGKGVTPDQEVDFQLPYANGKDPQMEAAMEAMSEKLCALPAHNTAPACSAADR